MANKVRPLIALLSLLFVALVLPAAPSSADVTRGTSAIALLTPRYTETQVGKSEVPRARLTGPVKVRKVKLQLWEEGKWQDQSEVKSNARGVVNSITLVHPAARTYKFRWVAPKTMKAPRLVSKTFKYVVSER